METTLGTGLGDLAAFMVWPYLLIFIMLSYLVKNAFGDLIRQLIPKWKTVYTVLVLATLIGIPYAIFTDVTWVQIAVTYALGTSFHELILGKVIEAVTMLFGGE